MMGEPIDAFPSKGEVHNQSAVAIFQRGLGVIDDASLTRELGTLGLGPCIGVVLYQPDKKVLVVGHFDALTKVFDSFLEILKYVREAGLSDSDIDGLQVSICGGDATSGELYANIKKAVIDTSFGKIVLDKYNETNGK